MKSHRIKINLFTNNFRSINVIKLLSKKYKLKNIILAKKNLSKVLIENLKKKKIKYFVINNLKNKKIIKLMSNKSVLNIVCGFPYIFPKKIIKNTNYPIINCHGGSVPNYRGGSPLSWQIINGEKKIGLSTLTIDKGIDNGKILKRFSFKLKKKMNILDVQKQANLIFPKLVDKSIEIILDKKKLQNQIGKIKTYKQRQPGDSFFIPKNTTLEKLNNLHKATYPLYCPPFYKQKKKTIYIEDFKSINKKKIFTENKKFIFLKIKDSNILIKKYSFKNN